MKWLLFALAVAHGLLHLMGFAKAYGLGELAQLSQPISRGAGALWLVAASAMLVTAALLLGAPRSWWAAGLPAVVLSQVMIAAAWTDARFGTVANAIILLAVIHGFASEGPLGLRSEYRREVGSRLQSPAAPRRLAEADLAGLPGPVQRYLRVTGAVGQPRVAHLRAGWRGRIRAGPDDPWMEFTAEQRNFVDEPSRFFLMNARRGGLPLDVLHVYEAGAATMRVRLLSLLPLVNASGPDMTRAETVTLLNDLCILAPAALIDPSVRWETIDDRSARAVYTVGENTVSATLVFDDAGYLQDFVSDDRMAMSADGDELVRRRWSTPVSEYRTFGERRAMGRAEGRWHAEEGDFAYIELELLDLEINGVR